MDATRGAAGAVLIVIVDGTRIAIDLAAVREVIANPVVTPLPHMPSVIAGVLNLRYEILATLDLGALRGGRSAARRAAVVVEDGDLAAAVLVDAVDDLAVDADRRPPTVLGGRDILHHRELLPFRGEALTE